MDAEAMARDFDAAMLDMRYLIRPNAGPEVLLPVRLRLLGMGPASLEANGGETLASLKLVCGRCKSWRECARDMAREDGLRGLSSYCINAGAIDALGAGRSAAITPESTGSPDVGAAGGRSNHSNRSMA